MRFFREAHLEPSNERRNSRRFIMALPLAVRSAVNPDPQQLRAQTRDVSFRGLYFLTEQEFEVGTRIEFVLTLPKEITLATDVHIRCNGLVVRAENHGARTGIAASIERYEFVPENFSG
jgi:hypothetical protein